jgi:transposase InsO family protein
MNLEICCTLLRGVNYFSKSGNPYDNACMESFVSSFKREEYNGKDYEYFDKLEESVASYMKYYNDYRSHQTL